MLDWEKLKVFYNVAESGSFTHAATRLRLDQSVVSRQMSQLEDRMGVPLFARHTRGVTLTEQGVVLFRTARAILAELEIVKAQILEKSHTKREVLKICATVGYGISWIAPRLHKLEALYPDLQLIMHVSDSPLDLTIHEADVSITASEIHGKDIVSEYFFSTPLPIYASVKYMENFGIPHTIDDLDHHRLIAFNDTSMIPAANINWLLSCGRQGGSPRTAYLEINSLHGIGNAVNAGAGIACLPPYIAGQYPHLVQILPESMVPTVNFYFSYSRHLQELKKIQHFLAFIKEEVAEYAIGQAA